MSKCSIEIKVLHLYSIYSSVSSENVLNYQKYAVQNIILLAVVESN